jgi:TonB-dependent starch-binding outer membrane protein SusC
MKTKLFLFSSLLFSIFVNAQTFDIKGKVLDSNNGLPLPGVNIIIKNTQLSTTTSYDGTFKINKVSKGSVLIFSYLGFRDYSYNIINNADVSISMEDDTQKLGEVVVIGYGTKNKKDVTGAVSYISSKTIEELRPIITAQVLQGTVSGVTVNSGSGAPGAGFNINIRGVSSNTNNQPYYLIDGYEGDISLLNPSDIESISILKDAQASVYGSKGANGVIIVTTKQGKKNSKTKVSFNSYVGQQETSKKLNLLNATEYALLLNESYANGGQALPYPNVAGIGMGTDWQSEVFKKATVINNDFNISGGSDKITYSFSGSKIKQDGIVGLDKSGFDRSTARVSLGVDLSDKFNLSTNLIYTDYNRQGLNENGIGSVLFNAINTPATLSLYDASGNYSLVPDTPGFGNEVINPLAQIENTYNSYNQKKINGNIVLQYKPLEEFKITARYGFNSGNDVGKSFSKKLFYGAAKVFNVDRNSVSQNATRFNDFTFDLFGEYEKLFFENHKIKFTLGGTLVEKNGEGLYGTGFDVPYNSWDYADIQLANGIPVSGVITSGSYKSTPYKRPSLFATLDYNFKEKYLLSFILRRDQSSSFAENNSVAYFKSILGGWIVSQEDFFNKEGLFNFLKLRGSYGTLGNDVAGPSDYRSTLTGEATYVFDNALVNGVAVGKIPNINIKWETDTKLDLGLDLRMLKDKVEITADYFNDLRTDLLVGGVPISGINGGYAPGSGAPTVNAGTVRNKGFEFSINYKNNINQLKYSLGFNVTTINNKVIDVKNSTGFIERGTFAIGQLAPTRMEIGQPIGVFYGLEANGIFQNQTEIDSAPSQTGLGSTTSPGDIRFKDVNGDGVINFFDRTYIGKPIADYNLGFNLNLNYKNFDFIAYSYASIGNDLIRNYERTENKLNKLNYILARWTGEGTSNSVPRVTTGATNNNLFSSYFVEDASFLRIQNVQLGYSLPKSAIEKIGISKIRLYASVNNLYTFTKYKGFDPTANSGDPIAGGVDYGYYPVPRIYTFGLNVNF